MVLEKGSGMSVPLLPPVEAQEHGSPFTTGPGIPSPETLIAEKEEPMLTGCPKAQDDILRLVSTLLVLQLVRVRKLVQGELLQSLFRLRDPPQHSSSEWEALKQAVDWVRWADRQYPCVCSRLQFGRDWESSTQQLLGFDRPHPLSPFNPLLERSRTILAC
ncbi:hypothetical protein AALO_G00046520 [Alosa alosa]|uniref:PARP4 MVP-ID C-terminal domain-containing protein n=1 Tax=Alosa alosa TaxID=278164 RepID=A0AAV6HD90_9TELE|nr:hypothetical protein AALO_G00046520 [Alosa alosa]